MEIKHVFIGIAMTAIAATAVCGISYAQPAHPYGQEGPQADRYVHTANYDLAERFSAKKVSQMVFSTQIHPNWFRNSDKFWYEWKTSDGTRYYIMDPASGSKSEIFDMERLAMQLTQIVRDPYDAQHIPMQNLKLKDDKYFTFDITSTQDKPQVNKKSEKMVYHFQYDFTGKTLTDVTDQVEHQKKECLGSYQYPHWAVVSPDGRIGVFVKNHDLFYMDSTNLRKAAKEELAKQKGDKDFKDSTIVEHRITTDGTMDHSWNGDSYFGDNDTSATKRTMASIAWSPDSKRFATIRYDMSKVKKLWVINSLSMPRPTLETYHYLMPGEPGPKGNLYVFTLDQPASGQSAFSMRYIKTVAFKDQDINIETAPRTVKDEYIDFYSPKWLGDNDGFYIARLSRDIHRVDICYVSGTDSTRTVISERMNTYIETRPLRLIKGGSQMIHWSERNGWANLYLYDSNGKLIRNLTEGAYHVEDILGINEAAGYVLFSACGVNKDENPYQMHTFKVSLNGGTPQQLDMNDMDVLSTASDDARYFVANYSRVDCKPAVAICGAMGAGSRKTLEEADLSKLLAAGYKFPERFKVKAADGITDLYGAIYKPFDFDSTKVYPICDYVYPGPQVEANNISWSSKFTRTDRLAQLGFIVITVGNRGGHPNRSKWYHNYGYGNLRDYGLEDQKYAIQQLAQEHSYIDINRVGIHGHSGGGFMSTAAILTYPDFFKVAVSCSGNHDNTIYNRWWSEQHHGILEKIDKGDTTFVYHIDTNEELAKNLKGHLMLWTGDIDNNVHPANTIRVINALIKANKRFDMMMLPGQRHGYGDMNEYFFWKLADYYSEYLLGDSQRHVVDIYQMNND
jgi:dipeptidyl-peptidase-4